MIKKKKKKRERESQSQCKNAPESKRETKEYREKRREGERDVFQRWPQENPQHWRCEIPTGFSGTEPHSCQGHVWSG